MMATGDWLLLRLPPTVDQAPSWLPVDASGAMLSPAGEGHADLRALAAGRQVALVVPAGDVALFNVQLPAGNEARLQQLAPFALEEQVSDDLDQLHFAVGTRDVSGNVSVAVVDRERMRQWLAEAAALSVEPRAVFAESDLLPPLDGHVSLLLDASQIIVREGASRSIAFPADDPELAITALLGADTDLSQVQVVVYTDEVQWPRHQAAFEALRPRLASLRVQLVTGGVLALHAQGLATGTPVNLLQGAYKPQGGTAVDWARWRWVAIALLALGLVHVAGTLWELRQLRATSASLDQEVAQVYASIFPGQSPGATPRRTIETRMRAVAGGGNAAGELMPLLAALAAARQNVPVASLDSLSFKPGTLQLKLSAPDAATLEQFSQALRAGGYTAQVTSGRQLDGGFEGQIDMSVAGT